MENVTRRTAFGIVIGAGTGVTMLSEVPAYAGPSEMEILIEAHKVALAKFEEADDRSSEAWCKFADDLEDRPITYEVPSGFLTKPGRVHLFEGVDNADRIVLYYSGFRAHPQAMLELGDRCPNQAAFEAKLALLDERQAVALANHAAAWEEYERRAKTFGLDALNAEVETAEKIENALWSDLIAFEAASLSDVRTKARYLASLPHGAAWLKFDGKEGIESLLLSFAGRAAS